MRFTYLAPSQGPVIEGLEDHEKIIALEQAEYLPLRMLPAQNGNSLIYRIELTPSQRQLITEGGDLLFEIVTFKGPLAPSRVMVIDDRNIPEDQRETLCKWFAEQTEGPYRNRL